MAMRACALLLAAGAWSAGAGPARFAAGAAEAAAPPAVFVTTAEGPEGFAMATGLLRRQAGRGRAAALRVLAGVPDLRAAPARRLAAAGAELRLLADPPRPEAFAGASWAFVLAPLTADRLARGRALIDAARAAGVRRAALLSVVGAGPGAPPSLGAYYHLEQYLASVWQADHAVVLRTYFYQQNLLLWAPDAQSTGELRLPIASGCFAPLYEADVAEVVASLATDPALAAVFATGRPLNLTGPLRLSGREVATAASRAVGPPGLGFEEVDKAAAARTLEAGGKLDPSEAALLLDLLELQTRPEACKMSPSADFQAITGRVPTDIEVFFQENAAAFRRGGAARHRVLYE